MILIRGWAALTVLAFALITVDACATTASYPPVDAGDARAVWLQFGLPDPAGCPVSHLSAGETEFRERCGFCGPGFCGPDAPGPGEPGACVFCGAGCTVRGDGVWFVVTHVKAPGVLYHELAHAWLGCRTGDMDAAHTNPQAWCDFVPAMGGAASAGCE